MHRLVGKLDWNFDFIDQSFDTQRSVLAGGRSFPIFDCCAYDGLFWAPAPHVCY